jgi:UDP-3-O-[3-hydroxymyristoyl] glucosamine N-acyltransferase
MRDLPAKPTPPVWTLGEIADRIEGTVHGDPAVVIRGVAGLDDAQPDSLVRVEHPRYLARALACRAGALLVDREMDPGTRPAIRVQNVRVAFPLILQLFSLERKPDPGIHPTAVLGAGTELGPGCFVGAYAVLGERVKLAPGVTVHPHAVIGDDVEVGEGSTIFPQAVLYPRTVVGQRVRVHSGAVVGADGYGYEWNGKQHLKKPHNGRVRLGDDVEVGANATVDRATTGETVIGPGTKIDNLVQIGHNVKTGAHCLIVSLTGIAGSTSLGNGVVLGGQVGVNQHLIIGDGVQAAARSGLWGDQPAGAAVSGNPARPHRENVRIQAAIGRLPEMLRRLRKLEKRLGESPGSESD